MRVARNLGVGESPRFRATQVELATCFSCCLLRLLTYLVPAETFWQQERISSSVRQRSDALARRTMRSTNSSEGVMPLRSSQKITFDLPLIGPISMICSKPK